jgi:NAD(P)-dependent dehydrogenase (short-subunit alcohol dehydrogenase family)
MPNMSQAPRHAIVYGASGLIGWALVNELLASSQSATFTRISAVTNRPLDVSESHWPQSDSHRPNLQLVSGIDLSKGNGTTLANTLKQAVGDIETVTDVYYLGRSCRLRTIASY